MEGLGNMQNILFKIRRGLARVYYRLKASMHGSFVFKRVQHLKLDVGELFFQHNSEKGFLRYDMIVRLLAIENYYEKNVFGFDLYYRMQKCRMGKEWADKATDIFKDLIKSYEQNGYDEKSEITVDENLHLIDGSHRMALALYYQLPYISVKVKQYSQEVFCYDIRWFKVNGFSDDDINKLESKYNEIRKRYNNSFICTIWHPAKDYFNEIAKHLLLFGVVNEIRDYNLTKEEYQYYTRGIYAVDDIQKWKIEKKIGYMVFEECNSYSLRMVSLKIEDPDFRLKTSNHKTLSKKGELIKQLIRRAYKDRIEHYYHDVIIHIGDNFYQNKSIYQLMTMPKIDIKTILDHIHDYRYVITKIDVPYMPADFPDYYALGKDIDIICENEEEYSKILASILCDVEIYKDKYIVKTVPCKDKHGREYRTLVRLEQEGQNLAFLFDVATQHRTGRASARFSQDLIANRQSIKNYYIPSFPYEIVVRLDEYNKNNKKAYHLAYVKNHLADIDEHLCDKYLEFNWRKFIKWKRQR